ncbi:Ff.00g012900.m01.CDS01 [Fusarium sp. VM40]|nr:Ff.00g012900.m01.CDS01 [Fusarium sp. VM40]
MANSAGIQKARKGRHLNGQKFACLKCIRGNRSEQCKPGKHMEDLRWIRPRGRPPGARNNGGPKLERKFCPEKFTALSADEVGRVPAEEILLPAEGNQAQVADGQTGGFTAQLHEASMAILEVNPNLFAGEPPLLDWDPSAAQPQEYPQPMHQYGHGDGFYSSSYDGQLSASDPSLHTSHPGSQPAFEYHMQ